MPETPASATTVRPTGAGARVVRHVLLAMRGDAVETHPLPLAGTVTIGRGAGCEIQIDDPSLSRSHLRLDLDTTSLQVTDLGSANGTTVGATRLTAHRPARCSPDDILGAGDVTFVVQRVRTTIHATRPVAPTPTTATMLPSAPVPLSAPVVADPAMCRLYELAGRVARGDIGVLIVGETGVGKEVLAEHIHRSSPRAGQPLVRVNCAALVDSLVEAELFGHERGAFTGAVRERQGLLESANGGTLFLDEIGELAPAIQAKLLRVVEERQVLRVGSSTPRAIDVRVLAATNRALEDEVDAGRFRRDLYFRLAGVVLAIPPLRERPAEIELLAHRFAAAAAARLGRPRPRLTERAVSLLRTAPWPGNARQLRNAVERAVLLVDGDVLDGDVFEPLAATTSARPASADPTPAVDGTLRDALAALERQRIVDALARHQGNQSRAAIELGLPRRSLVKRLTAYGLPRPRKGTSTKP